MKCLWLMLLMLQLLCFIDVSPEKVKLCGKCWCSFETHHLSCSSLNLAKLPDLTDDFLEEFHVVDVSNNHLTSLNVSLMRQSLSKLRRLIASRNKIEQIPKNTLRHMTSLVYLDLSWNDIRTSLSIDQFRDVIQLDYLSLSHNQVSCITKDVFRNANRLTELDLSYNKLTSLATHNTTSCFPRKAICDLKSLIVLRLSSNYLPHVFEKDGFFSCLPNLTLLEASNCGIKIVSRNAFTGLHHMISLDLSDNSIAFWPEAALNDSRSLVYLDLGQNLLSKLPPDFLKGCPGLTHIQIRNNRFENMDYKWLESFGGEHKETNLTINESIQRAKIFLSFANFQAHLNTGSTLSSTTQTTRILYLDWSENPWSCNCALISFVAWLIEEGKWMNDVNGYRDVICNDREDHRLTRRSVYVDGKVNKITLSELLNQCIANVVTSSSSMPSSNYDVKSIPYSQMSVNHNEVTTFTPKNISKSSNFIDFSERSLSPHLMAIIAICVIADILAYVIIMFLIKKRFLCKRKSSSVAP